MRYVSKSEATGALRILFGPTARIAKIRRSGLDGVRVLVAGGVAFQTFELGADVWRRCVRACLRAANGGIS